MAVRFLALLRGINIGGNNIIKIDNLKSCFLEMGFSNLTTYIQSGNVLFDSTITDLDVMVSKIERALSDRFHYNSKVVVISQTKLIEIVNNAPEGFGSATEE